VASAAAKSAFAFSLLYYIKKLKVEEQKEREN
jgi:hypothetical protein